MKSRLYL